MDSELASLHRQAYEERKRMIDDPEPEPGERTATCPACDEPAGVHNARTWKCVNDDCPVLTFERGNL